MKKTIAIAAALVFLLGNVVSQNRVEYKWRGFYTTLDYTYAFNLNRSADDNNIADTMNAHIISFVSGFQFRKEAGVGAGVAYVADPTGAFSQLPIFVELRSHYTRNRLSPYSVVQAGYSFAIGSASEPPSVKITEGGLYFGLDLGGRFAIDRGFAVAVHASFKMLQSNKVERKQIDGSPYLEDARTMYLVGLGASLYF